MKEPFISDEEREFPDDEPLLVRQDIIYPQIERLVPYHKNAKLHENTVGYLKNLIGKVKFRNPIYVDQDFVIIEGHGRRLAAMELGMKRVPVIVVTDMSPEEVRLKRVADNWVTEKAEYDLDMLGLEVKELEDEYGFDMMDFGFDFDMDIDIVEEEAEEEEVPEEYEEAPIKEPEEPFIQTGDVIIFESGHRLVCGDSTDIENIRLALDYRTADICFTSPPYNAGHLTNVRTPREGPKYINTEDLRDYDEYEDFIFSIIDNLLENCEEVFINIGLLAGSKSTIVHLLNRYLDKFKDVVYWKKANPVPAVKEGVISSAVEWVICLGRNGSRQFRHKHDIWYGVIEGSVASGNAYSDIHKATFPLYLPTEMIKIFTEEGDLVLDCFGGTGTTMIACHDTGRTCAMVELEPLYCDIIVQRMVEHSGCAPPKVLRGSKELEYPLFQSKGAKTD